MERYLTTIMSVLGLPTIKFADAAIQRTWERGGAKLRLVKIIELLLRYISIEYINVDSIYLTDSYSSTDNEDQMDRALIYIPNTPVKEYKRMCKFLNAITLTRKLKTAMCEKKGLKLLLRVRV